MMLRTVLTGVLAHETLSMARQKIDRDIKYALASQLAHNLGGPLLVVGGPYGSNMIRDAFSIKAHGPGDV